MASELHPWRFELEMFPSRLPCGHVFEPKLNPQQGAICEKNNSKCVDHRTSWCFGSHFFVARFHHLFRFFFFLKEKHGRKLLCQLFTATNCSTLARHALKLICQTTFDSILFKSLLSHAGQLSCLDVTEVT